MNDYIYKGGYEAPKRAGTASFIKDLAWKLDLECTIDVDEGGFFRPERGRFKIEGSKNRVFEFVEMFETAGNDYNERLKCRSEEL